MRMLADNRKNVMQGLFAALLISLASTGNLAASPAVDAFGQERRAFADGLMSRGLFRLALPEYKALAAAQPEAADLDVILYRLAECQRQVGDLSAASATCGRLLADFPASKMRRRAALVRGLILLDTGNPSEAGSLLDGIATDPQIEKDLQMTALFHAASAREDAGELHAANARYAQLIKNAAEAGAAKNTKELAAYAELRIASLTAAGATTVATNEALAHFRKIAAKPFSPRIAAEALYQAATLAYNGGMNQDAVALFRELRTKFRSDFRIKDSAISAAWANYRAELYADAITILNDAEDSAEAVYLKANCLARLKRFPEAVAAYDALLKANYAQNDGMKKAAEYERLVALYKCGEYKRVLSDAASVTPEAAMIADFYWLQAEAAESLRDDSRATQFYMMLLKKAPASPLAPDAAYRLASGLQRKESWQEASRIFLSIATAFPTNALVPQALFSSGYCNARLGKSAEALRDWGKLIDSFPTHEIVPDALFQKAMEEIRVNDMRTALSSLDKLLNGRENFKLRNEALFWRARIHYELKDYALAEKDVRAALASCSSEEIKREAQFLLGLLLQATGRETEAAECFQPLLDSQNHANFSPERLAWLSEFQYARGQYKAARDAAVKLAEREDSGSWLQVAETLSGRAFLAMADTNSAVAAFKKAADMSFRTKYAAEAALRLAEISMFNLPERDAAKSEILADATRYFERAAEMASTPELASIRANAYLGLAKCAEKKNDSEGAIRYAMAVSMLFDDENLVTQALEKAAALLRSTGRSEEADATLQELKTRYPAKQ